MNHIANKLADCIKNLSNKAVGRLLALQDIAASDPAILGHVSELDETFFLQCFKGKELPSDIGRPARRHGQRHRSGTYQMNMSASKPAHSCLPELHSLSQ